jgi:hypothetical protein
MIRQKLKTLLISIVMVHTVVHSFFTCESLTVRQQFHRHMTLYPSPPFTSQRLHPTRSSFRYLTVAGSSVGPSQEESQQQKKNGDSKESFWTAQKELAVALTNQVKLSARQEQMAKFEKRRLALVVDTAYIAWFIFCACWMCFDNPMTSFSFAFGATMGIAYAFGLGKSVEAIGQSIDDIGATQGAGVGEARFAFLILLLLFVGKFRGGDYGLQEIPSIAGFFTYQIASLNQGLREIND